MKTKKSPLNKKTVHIITCDAFLYELEKTKDTFALAYIFGCNFITIYLTKKLYISFDELKQALIAELAKIEAVTII